MERGDRPGEAEGGANQTLSRRPSRCDLLHLDCRDDQRPLRLALLFHCCVGGGRARHRLGDRRVYHCCCWENHIVLNRHNLDHLIQQQQQQQQSPDIRLDYGVHDFLADRDKYNAIRIIYRLSIIRIIYRLSISTNNSGNRQIVDRRGRGCGRRHLFGRAPPCRGGLVAPSSPSQRKAAAGRWDYVGGRGSVGWASAGALRSEAGTESGVLL